MEGKVSVLPQNEALSRRCRLLRTLRHADVTSRNAQRVSVGSPRRAVAGLGHAGAQVFSWVDMAPGSVLIQRNSHVESLYFLTDGVLSVRRAAGCSAAGKAKLCRAGI